MKNPSISAMFAAAVACSLIANASMTNVASAQRLKPARTQESRKPNDLVHRGTSKHGQTYAIVDDDILFVTGDPNHEKFVVEFAAQSDEIIVRRSVKYIGAGTFGAWQTFLLQDQDIDEIIVDLGAGDDTFFNNTELPSTISGNAGHDVLIGGLGPDEIYGGSGGDVIFGFAGADYIEGGPQSDILCGGMPAGSDQIIDFMTLELDYSKLKPENFLEGHHVDLSMDELRGGFEDPTVDADWFIMEVATAPSIMETSIAIDFVEDFDWMTFNNHD